MTTIDSGVDLETGATQPIETPAPVLESIEPGNVRGQR